MRSALGILIAGFIVAALWFFTRRAPLFVITIAGGNAQVTGGSAPQGFVADCRELAQDVSLPSCRIVAFAEKGEVFFSFSRSMPERYRQRVKNLWHVNFG